MSWCRQRKTLKGTIDIYKRLPKQHNDEKLKNNDNYSSNGLTHKEHKIKTILKQFICFYTFVPRIYLLQNGISSVGVIVM